MYMNDTNYVTSVFWTVIKNLVTNVALYVVLLISQGLYNGKATVYNVKNELMFCGELKLDIK